MTPAMTVQKELLSIPDMSEGEDGLFAKEKKVLANAKKAGLMIAGAAVQKFMMKLSEEQEILMHLADMLIEIYIAESCLLRVEKIIEQRNGESSEPHMEMAMIYLHGAIEKLASNGRQAIMAFAEGDQLRLMLLGLKRFSKIEPYNLKAARRKVADYVIGKGAYPF